MVLQLVGCSGHDCDGVREMCVNKAKVKSRLMRPKILYATMMQMHPSCYSVTNYYHRAPLKLEQAPRVSRTLASWFKMKTPWDGGCYICSVMSALYLLINSLKSLSKQI